MVAITLQSVKEQRLENNTKRKKLVEEIGDAQPTEPQKDLLASLKSRSESLKEQQELLASIEADAADLSGEGDEIPQHRATLNAVAKHDDGLYGYTDPRQFLSDVLQGVDDNRVPERLMNYQVNLQNALGSDEQSVISDPYGGFLTPPGFMPTLLKVDNESDPTAPGGIAPVTSIPISTPSLKIPARVDKDHSTGSVTGGFRVMRKAETQTGTSSRGEFEQVELEPKTLYGIAYATERILRHSAISLTAILQEGMSTEFQSEKFKEKIQGTGAGEFEGILNSPAGISIGRLAAGNDIEGADIINMRSRAWRYGRCIWLANHDALPDLEIAHRTGTNADSFYFRAGSVIPGIGENASVDVPDTLLGRPIIFTEYLPSLGASGDIVLWDPSQYLVGHDVTVGANGMAESIHVRFEAHERTFKFFEECDARSWWRSPLQPLNGANTLSPIVYLDAA